MGGLPVKAGILAERCVASIYAVPDKKLSLKTMTRLGCKILPCHSQGKRSITGSLPTVAPVAE